MTAVELFEKTNRCGHVNVSANDQKRCKVVIDSFKAVATSFDLAILSAKPSDLVVMKCIMLLHDRVVGRLTLAYTDAKVDIPSNVKKWRELTVNSLSERLKELDSAIPGKNIKERFTLGVSKDEFSRLPSNPSKFSPALKRKLPSGPSSESAPTKKKTGK